MATFKFTGGVSPFRDKLIGGMVARGYEPAFAERTFAQLEGFGSYGFPESHAASFALIAYASSWLKCWHPDVFCAALLNAQPMGFYPPAQIVRDARDHCVEVRPICVNASRWDCTLEPTATPDRFAVRLGLRMVRGLATAHAAAVVGARADRPFASVDDLWRRVGVPAALVKFAKADAFRPSLGLARREALWTIKALRDEPLPLFAAASAREAYTLAEVEEPSVSLRPMTAGGEVVQDYRHAGLSLREHPVAFLRADLAARRIVSCAEASKSRDGCWLETAGIVLVRQMPGSANGVLFVTLEDETGVTNLIIWPKLYARQRRVVLAARMLGVRGRVQREGAVVHLIANRLSDLSAELAGVGEREAAFPLPHGPRVEAHHGSPGRAAGAAGARARSAWRRAVLLLRAQGPARQDPLARRGGHVALREAARPWPLHLADAGRRSSGDLGDAARLPAHGDRLAQPATHLAAFRRRVIRPVIFFQPIGEAR
jgi:error-prone DNA polymerase